MKHLLHVVGARPNFMKVAPVLAACRRPDVRQTLVHTGQHYDANMSDIFFEQLGLPRPDVSLGVGSGSHAAQTAQIMLRFEDAVLADRPDAVLVYGDVNSTVAAALVSAKLGIPVAHVEAGLRSGDRTMPEELNRLVTDQLSDLLLTPSADADENLLASGTPREKIHLVGNVMVDTLVRLLPQARLPEVPGGLPAEYALVTLHRPSNVDDSAYLAQIVQTLVEMSRTLPIVFPVHPRTRAKLAECGQGLSASRAIHLLDPAGYLEFLALERSARVVITDSGGIQEETTYLQVPCLTLRENTERPVTVTLGTNVLVGRDLERLAVEVDRILSGQGKAGQIPPLWDGQAGRRVADVVLKEVERKEAFERQAA